MNTDLLILMSHALQAVIEQPNYAAFREYEIFNLGLRQKNNFDFSGLCSRAI